MSTEASCRKYLDAIANKIYVSYTFTKKYGNPTMGDLLAAKDGREGDTWEYRTYKRQKLATKPLPDVFSMAEWEILSTLNADTTQRIHDAQLPLTSSQKPYVIIPHSKFTITEYVGSLKRIAAIADVVFEEDDLVVKDESDL